MGGLSNGSIPDLHASQTEGSQIGDHRLSISCGVVERPDHRCGDDLVLQETTETLGGAPSVYRWLRETYDATR